MRSAVLNVHGEPCKIKTAAHILTEEVQIFKMWPADMALWKPLQCHENDCHSSKPQVVRL